MRILDKIFKKTIKKKKSFFLYLRSIVILGIENIVHGVFSGPHSRILA